MAAVGATGWVARTVGGLGVGEGDDVGVGGRGVAVGDGGLVALAVKVGVAAIGRVARTVSVGVAVGGMMVGATGWVVRVTAATTEGGIVSFPPKSAACPTIKAPPSKMTKIVPMMMTVFFFF
ncbi:MAG: hypothetical protein B6I35_12955 [Anaerolineaceae bacterium 4572_32.2]|nr:MAG: hypothetical protein B6I35_12955 [Anaerolineaceae bacterium 4572_32.2]